MARLACARIVGRRARAADRLDVGANADHGGRRLEAMMGQAVGLGLTFGAALGAALGIVAGMLLGNIPLRIVFGMALGPSVGMVIGMLLSKTASNDARPKR